MIMSTAEKSALQKAVKVVVKRLKVRWRETVELFLQKVIAMLMLMV